MKTSAMPHWHFAFQFPGGHRFVTRAGHPRPTSRPRMAIEGEKGRSLVSRTTPIRPYSLDARTYKLRLFRGWKIITEVEKNMLVSRYGFKLAEEPHAVTGPFAHGAELEKNMLVSRYGFKRAEEPHTVTGPFAHGAEVLVGTSQRRGRVLGPVHNFGLEPQVPVLFENPTGSAYTQSIAVKHVQLAPAMPLTQEAP